MTDEHDDPAAADGSTSTSTPAAPTPGSGSGSGGPRRTTPTGRRDLMEAVAADLRAMRGRLDTTHDLVHQHAGLLSEALPQLEQLTEGVAVLTGRVNALAGATSDDDTDATGPYDDTLLGAYGLLPDPGHQVDWHLMSAEQARPAWEALAAWVAAVVCGRLGFTRAQLPDCWALHPRAVAELSWAHQLHRVYAGPGVGALALAEWHTRWLPQLHSRLAKAIVLDDDDPLGVDVTTTGSGTAPRCRLGHYHQLSPKNRRVAELGLDQRAADPERPGRDQRDRSRLTGHAIASSALREPGALEALRRGIVERRHQAQQHLDRHLDPYLRGASARGLDPARPRYLPLAPADAHRHADPATEQPAHPALWLPLYRDAAHHDLAARRHREQHPDQQRPDVTLDTALVERGGDPGSGSVA